MEIVRLHHSTFSCNSKISLLVYSVGGIIKCTILQLLPDCKYKSTEVRFLIGSEEFTWSGCTSDSPGYTEVYTWHAIQGDETPKVFETSQVWEVHQVLNRLLQAAH